MYVVYSGSKLPMSGAGTCVHTWPRQQTSELFDVCAHTNRPGIRRRRRLLRQVDLQKEAGREWQEGTDDEAIGKKGFWVFFPLFFSLSFPSSPPPACLVSL